MGVAAVSIRSFTRHKTHAVRRVGMKRLARSAACKFPAFVYPLVGVPLQSAAVSCATWCNPDIGSMLYLLFLRALLLYMLRLTAWQWKRRDSSSHCTAAYIPRRIQHG